jgi:hypothetical protein
MTFGATLHEALAECSRVRHVIVSMSGGAALRISATRDVTEA